MADEMDPWQWSWYGAGTPDKKPGRGRVYYKGVEAFRRTDNMKRIYNVGDTVNMIGEEHQVWTAQLVDLFQVKPDDEDLRRILRHDSRRATGDARYEYMRCTLRWFYNPEDMKQETLRRSSVPKQIRNEIYFSDHVEISGFNSITVVDGLAWVFPSKHERDRWLRDPDVRYKSKLDIVRIVRTFVNSASPDLTVRELDTGELNYHLKNPTADKNLFDTGRQRARGKFSAASSIVRPSMKTVGSSTSKKRKRTPRAPIRIPDDDDDESDYEKETPDNFSKKREPKLEDNVENVSRSRNKNRKEKKRKVIVEEQEDDDDYHDDIGRGDAEDRVEPAIRNAAAPTRTTESPDLAAKQRAELQEAQDEVWDMINELNQNAATFDPHKISTEATHEGEGNMAPLSIGADEGNKANSTARAGQTAQRKKSSSSHKQRALQGIASSNTSSLRQRRSQSLGAIQRESSASSGLKKSASNSNVIIIDGDNDSDDGPKRMLPSITPRRTRIKEVSIHTPNLSKQRVTVKVTGKDRKVTKEGRTAPPILHKHEFEQSRRGSTEDSSAMNSHRKSAPESANEGKKEKFAASSAEKEVQRRKDVSDETSAGYSRTKGKVIHSERSHRGESTKPRKSTKPTDEEVQVDWWKETREVLQTLKNEFQSLTPVCQQLFRNHFDVVFDLAVKKVTSNGIFGNIDSKNEHLRTIVGEIVADLGETVLKNGGEGAHSADRLGAGANANVDKLGSAKRVVSIRR